MTIFAKARYLLMSKKKKKSKGGVVRQLPINPKEYILKVKNTLPLHECLLDLDTTNTGISHALITRKRPNGDLVLGMFMVDFLCLGVKDALYNIMDQESYEFFVSSFSDKIGADLEPVKPNVLYSYVHGAVDFAKKAGIKACPEYGIAGHLLDLRGTYEPAADVMKYGENGRYHYVEGPHDDAYEIMSILEKSLGIGNFDYTLMDDEEEEDDLWDDDEEEDDLWDDELEEVLSQKIGLHLIVFFELILGTHYSENNQSLLMDFKNRPQYVYDLLFSDDTFSPRIFLEEGLSGNDLERFFYAYLESRLIYPRILEDHNYHYLLIDAFDGDYLKTDNFLYFHGEQKRGELCVALDHFLTDDDPSIKGRHEENFEIFEKFCQSGKLNYSEPVRVLMEYIRDYNKMFNPITKEEYVEWHANFDND